jgi:CBS domain-containing protein
MYLRDILVTKLPEMITIGPTATLTYAVVLMCRHRVGSLLVVDPAERLVGILTERDVLEQCMRWEPLDHVRVERVMTREPIVGDLDDDLRTALARMSAREVRHLPVVADSGELRGVVSLGDVLDALVGEEEGEIRSLREYMSGP